MIYNYEDITQIHLEPTQKCQARCPMCNRTEKDGSTNRHLNDDDLSLEDIKKILPVSFVKQLKNLYMCGNHGDPIFAPDCLDIMKWLRVINPKMHLSLTTNGGAKSAAWWEELATVVNQVIFSVDGLEDTNHLYRQGVSWKNIENNMEAFCDAGGNAKWVFLVFQHNEHQVEEAERFAKLIGVKNFEIKKSARFVSTKKNKERKDVKTKDRSGNVIYLINEPTKPEYQNKELVKAKKVIESNKKLSVNISCKAIPKKEIYISAEGLVHPCCWTANTMYKWWDPIGKDPVWGAIEDINNINAFNKPIKEILEGNFFDNISKSWDSDNPLEVCTLKCNTKYDAFSAQWK